MQEFLWEELSKTFEIELINRQLSHMTDKVDFPNVLRKAVIEGRQFIVCEHMKGTSTNFKDKPPEMMEEFGKALAEIHSHQFFEWGNVNGSTRYTLCDFPQKLSNGMLELGTRYYSDHPMIMGNLDYYCSRAANMQVPKYSSFIMLDMDPRQFLEYEGCVSALVDTEAYVLGPREVDLVAIEASVDQEGANNFKRGYSQVLPFPELSQLRDLYRFFFCLLQIKGPDFGLHEWISGPHYFE